MSSLDVSTSDHQEAERHLSQLAQKLKPWQVLNLEGTSEYLGLLFISQMQMHRLVAASALAQENYCSFFLF